MEILFYIVGLIATALCSIGLISQVVKGFITKHVKDVSMLMVLSLCLGTFFWLIYGIWRGDYIIVIANIIGVSSTFTLLIQKKLYKNY